MKLRTLMTSSALILTGALSSSYANAIIFDFDVTYDGTNISLDAGSDTALGTMIADGDGFNYNIGAMGDDFWKVDVTTDYFPLLAFQINEAGDRDGTFALDLLLDGVSQFSLLPAAVRNREIHLGTNTVSLVAGLMFDEIILDYTLTSAVDLGSGAPIDSTIGQYVIGGAIPQIPGGFTEGISYNTAAAVPAPAPLALIGLGIAALGWSRRKTS